MEANKKVTRIFSVPLMKQNIKANWVLCLAILIIMLLMGNVINFAMSIMEGEKSGVDVTEYQQEFYTYLGAMAVYDTMTGGELSYSDFAQGENIEAYDRAFEMLSLQMDEELSVAGFEASIEGLMQSGVDIHSYEKQFEYIYALAQAEGVFSKEELTAQEMLNVTLELMGVSSDMVQKLGEIDATEMLNKMYYTVIGLLPIFLLIVILANSLIAEQVDRGSMAYVLSTPTKRSAVAITQMIFMIVVPLILIGIVCVSRIITSFIFFEEVNVPSIIALFVGMYILVEAVCAICYMGSCLFSHSKRAMGFGGGITVWFFLASLLGMFGSESMVNSGMGVEELGRFNYMTLIGLFDIKALATVGTDAVDTTFVWKLAVLLGVAVVCYTVGAVRFSKKDLPL